MNAHRIAILLAAALVATACTEEKPAAEAPATGTEQQAQQAEKPAAQQQPTTAQPQQIPAPPDVAAVPEDAQKTESGLASKVLQPGTGDKKPGAEDVVTVHYTGWTTDGKMFDSSVTRGQPANFPLNRVIPGWTEGLQLMTVGEKRRFWIPEELAYKGRPGPQGMLVFDVELIGIKEAPKPIPAPEDVKAAPKDARKLPSGVAIKQLQKGTGEKKPGPTDRVEVHYTGWTTDGKMFDSSVVRGRPATFPLNAVIPGWTQALQEMVEGEKARIWIPEELAYKGRPGAPQGMLVFDVELLDIVDAAPKAPTPAPAPTAKPPQPAK
jgi:FKBP-type peptidyl-prolyl cis-trans isomerase